MTYPLGSNEPGVPASPDFPQIERGILAFWKGDQTFQASIDQREGCPEWVFYDGPPFANGLPHYGHLLTGYAKDLFPRYQTMRGKQVQRRFGWDTHGLPAELEAMRQLGITQKHEIEEMGIGVFNAKARESVLRYTDEWESYVTRQARWVDFENDYKTLNVEYMESVIWAFKQLHEKGLAYEGFRVLPYCWNDETPLSNHELRMDDDVYQMRQDQSVTVTFPLVGEKAEALGLTGVEALAWTTTPWTLPTNLALAVGPEIAYAIVPSTDGVHQYLLAADTIGSYSKEFGYESADAARAAVTRTVRGAELGGIHYDRLWDYYEDADTYGTQNAWQILVADYVATGEGTGIVHQAPAYGEDDQVVCAAAGIPVILSLDDGGRFLSTVPEVAGQHWFDANKQLVTMLRAEGRLVQVKSYEHSYPHCWRCRNPLIYKAVSSWFIRVPEFRDRMSELNQQINWVPENVKDGQFGKWLSNARDWSISRNRYWGSPIPVWKSDDPEYPRVDVYGSLDELELDFGVRLTDLHRPVIDELTRPNPDDPTGRSTMRRIPDVMDVWFDSGSMPFAQVHYPFENREWFDSHSPADFIVEYIGQTRGWFYLLHVLSTALFDRPAFTNVLSHGIVLGNDGQKMSKSLRNYPDVNEVFDRDGSDAMRWFLLSSSVIRGGNIVVTEEGIRAGVRELLLPLWSTYYFFTLYSNTAEGTGYHARFRTDSPNVLDRYLLAKTREVLETVQTHFDEFDTPFAAAALRDFGDVLTNWYVRRSRDRFWTGTDADAFDTLYTVLVTVSQVAAPLLPLVTEEIYRGLTGERSVHLSDWPNAAKFPRDPELVAAMDRVREIASSGLALRKARGLRVRLPLAGAEIVTNDSQELEAFAGILTDELNLKSVTFSSLSEAAWADFGIRRRLVVDAKVAGPRYGKQIQQILANAREDRWSVSLSDQPVMIVDDQNFFLKRDEYELVLDAGRADGAAVTPIPGGGFILIDVEVTPELEAEGIARDLIRQLQELRRSGQFHVSDRVAVAVAFEDSDDLLRLEPYRSSIAAETLSTVSFQRRDTFPLGIELLSQPQGLYNEIEAGKVGNTGKIVTEITGLERA